MANTGAMIGKQHQIRNSPVSISYASTAPSHAYTVPANISEVNVNTAGGNVRVNLPNTDRTIVINKTSSDSYLVTLYVAGTQIGEIAGERSSVVIESGQITKDEPWYPYDAIIGIAGVSGDGGEVIARDCHDRRIYTGVANISDESAFVACILNDYDHIYGVGDFKFSTPLSVHNRSFVDFELHGTISLSPGFIGDEVIMMYGDSYSQCQHNNIYVNSVIGNDIIDGILLQDAFMCEVRNSKVQHCLSGVTIKNENKWSEYNTIRRVLTESCLIGFNFIPSAGGGTGSFCNTIIDQCASNISTDNSYGICLNSGSAMSNSFIRSYRAWIANGVSGATGIKLLGNSLNLVIDNYTCENFNTLLQATALYLGTYGRPIIRNFESIGINDFVGYVPQCNIDAWRIPIITNGTYLVEFGNCISGNYTFSWSSTGREHHIAAHVNELQYTGGDLVKLSETRAGTRVISAISIYKNASGSTLYLTITIAGLSGESGYLYIKKEDHSPLGYGCCPSFLPTALPGGSILLDNIINGILENYGSSTGTGSEQTIAHGLAAIPTGCRAWVTYLVNGRYVTEMIAFDATNIYPTVTSGLAYTWGIGAV